MAEKEKVSQATQERPATPAVAPHVDPVSLPAVPSTGTVSRDPATNQPVIRFVQEVPKPPEPIPHANLTVPGGAYFVGGRWVDAESRPIKEFEGKDGNFDPRESTGIKHGPEHYRDYRAKAAEVSDRAADTGDIFNRPAEKMAERKG